MTESDLAFLVVFGALLVFAAAVAVSFASFLAQLRLAIPA